MKRYTHDLETDLNDVEYRHVSTSLFTGSILTSHYFMGGLKTNLFAT